MVDGVGVLSVDADPIGARLNMRFVGVGVAEVGACGDEKPLHAGSTTEEFILSSVIGKLSRSGVNNGTMRFHTEVPDSMPVDHPVGGLGV